MVEELGGSNPRLRRIRRLARDRSYRWTEARYVVEGPTLVGEAMAAGRYAAGFGTAEAAASIDEHLAGADTSHVEVLDEVGRNRIFNLIWFRITSISITISIHYMKTI